MRHKDMHAEMVQDVRLADAVQWKYSNPLAYGQIVAWAREDMKHGQRPAIDLYANLLRRPHFSQKLGLTRSDKVYKVNNNLRSSLARLIMREYANIKFETRASRCDQRAAVQTFEIRRGGLT